MRGDHEDACVRIVREDPGETSKSLGPVGLPTSEIHIEQNSVVLSLSQEGVSGGRLGSMIQAGAGSREKKVERFGRVPVIID
jgi:hypothetical protein